MEINCQILAGEEISHIKEACLTIEKKTIRGMEKGFQKDALDLRDYIALPGLINAHTHIGDSFAKEACVGMRHEEAVGQRGRKWSLYAQADEETIIDAMRETALDMLSSGTTSFIDFREGGIKGLKMLRKGLKDVPIKAVALGRDLKDDEFEGSDGLGLNIHQLSHVPKDRKGKLVGIHAGEGKGEIRDALNHGPDFLVHFTNPEEGDIEDAAKKQASIVVCPRSNAALGAGYPPVRELLDKGLNVALGTDNAMINAPDMWREMEYLCKHSQLEGPVTPNEALKMATVNAATMLRSNTGAIAEGRTADIIFIDTRATNLRHSRNPLATIVTRCMPENVRKVMIDGRFVLEKD